MVARTDNVTDPSITAALLLARRGQAYFSRKLNELSDSEFDEPCRLDGWNRRQLIAHVGLNARALTRLVEWARTGIETPMYTSPQQRTEEIEFAATLPVDLDNGARFEDFPAELLDALLTDILAAWDRRRTTENLPFYVLEVVDRDEKIPDSLRDSSSRSFGTPLVVRGTAAALVDWATGRGNNGVLTGAGSVPSAAPRWL